MNPDDSQLGQGGGEPQSLDPQATPANSPQSSGIRPAPPITPPQREGGTTVAQREAATNVIRGTIDNLYNAQNQATPKDVQPVAQQQEVQASNPYMRTHGEATTTQAEQWKQYHTAWQNYYQKYYETYYHHAAKQGSSLPKDDYFAKSADAQAQPEPVAPEEVMTKDEALLDLRQNLLKQVGESAQKIRRSRHFIPILAGTVIVLIFAFIQYNSFFIGTVAAYVSPGAGNAQDIIIDPTTDLQVSQDPVLIIPKINVNVPVSYDIGNDYDSQMAAMKNGLAWFGIPGANSHPGQVGNTVLAGHSSNDLFDTGDYKFIFAQLDKLTNGDTVYANYKGIRYTYVVTGTKVVAPDDVNSLVLNTDKPMLTLLTCTPVGTSKNRLLVFAEQVTPDPAQAATQPASTGSSATTIPGANAPTVFEKLFGANG